MEHLRRDERLTPEDEERMRRAVRNVNNGRMPFEGLLESPAITKWIIVLAGVAILAILVMITTN